MKRVLAIFLCLLLAIGMVALIACEEESTNSGDDSNNDSQGSHVHTYKTDAEWTADASGHWYEATCNCADVTVRKLQHVDDNKDGACDVCKYTDHEHNYSEEWTADCTNHWNAADCGCIIAGTNIEAHADETKDGVCDTCGYVIENLHKHYYDTKWTTDGEYHWHAALCEHGVEVADKAAHEINAAGYCTVCGDKLKDVDKTDVGAILEAAIANNHLVVSGSVMYQNEIPDINYTLTHSVYYVLGNTSSYEKRIEYGMAKERWYQLVGDDEVFGVTSEDGGFTISSISADIDSLKGYNYTPSTLLGSYDSTATLSETLWALYDISLKDTVTDRVVAYNADEDMYVMSYTYLAVREITGHDSMTDAGNDDSTAELQTVVITNLYEVKAYFTIDENFVIDEAGFIVGAYNEDIDHDYVYDVETGTYEMSVNALADTYAYMVAQTSGERSYYTAYPKASLVPTDFDLALPDGTIKTDTIEVAVGTNTTLNLVNLKPFSADTEFINPADFELKLVNKNDPEADTFYIYYDPFSGSIGFNPNAVGEYGLTITYGDLVKEYTIKATPAAPTSVKLYPFAWIAGYGENVYTVDEYNPGSLSTIKLDVGETIDFLVRVNPPKADQLYTITVDSEDASITEITLNNVVAFTEILEECTAYQFKSDVEGKYVITLTSTVNENITSTVEVYVGDVEQDVKASETYNITIAPSDFSFSDEVTFTVSEAGTYVISSDDMPTDVWFQLYNAAEDSWTQIQNSLPYSQECAVGDEITVRIFTPMGATTESRGKTVAVTIGKQASQDSVSYEIATPGSFEPSDEYVFTAEADGTYVITAEGLDASTWLQVYDAADDSWPQIQGSLPYSVELTAGETIIIRLYGWDDAVAGQMVTVTIASGTAGDGDDTPVLEGSGTDADPFVLVENGDYVCAFPGGYNYVFYTYTATQAGTLTISVAGNDFYWGIGQSFMTLNAGNSNPTQSVDLEAGESAYIGISTNSTDAADMDFTVTFESTGSGEGGGDPITTPDGTASNPYELQESNTCEFPGGYDYVFYTFTATEAGTLTITATSDDYYWGYGDAPYAMDNIGQVPQVELNLAAGQTIYFGASTNSADAGTITFTATFEASGSGAVVNPSTTLQEGPNQIEASNVTFEYTAEAAGTLNLSAGNAIMGMVEISYTVNGGDSTVLELGTSVDLALEAGDVVVITVVAEGYSSIQATWTEASAGGNTALNIGANQIEASNVTFEYTAEAAGTLNLSAGNAIMGMVEISYTVNGGDSTVLELGTNVDLALEAGDVVVITVVAEGYSSIQATWTEA